eukprot:1813667-Pyramimonas_sp.AAC.1
MSTSVCQSLARLAQWRGPRAIAATAARGDCGCGAKKGNGQLVKGDRAQVALCSKGPGARKRRGP